MTYLIAKKASTPMTFSEDELEEIFTKLDRLCWQCEGLGRHLFNGLTHTCDICCGTGYQPTRAGVELLNFLGRHRGRVNGAKERKNDECHKLKY